MFGLLFGSLSTMVQTGFIIGVGLLIDTFAVRTITVPALAVLIGRANWWPSKPTAAKVASSDIPIAAETSAADLDFADVRKARSTSCLVGEAAIERAEGRSRGEARTTQVFSGSALSPPASARGAALIKRGDCSLGAFSVWLHGLLDELDISRVTLVGQSLGGENRIFDLDDRDLILDLVGDMGELFGGHGLFFDTFDLADDGHHLSSLCSSRPLLGDPHLSLAGGGFAPPIALAKRAGLSGATGNAQRRKGQPQ